ncbi:MAG: hypothetical protein VYC42_07145 [Pseudomonadota bacterium]|nr:hypothetical protein [Pseudomonadota bacterium]
MKDDDEPRPSPAQMTLFTDEPPTPDLIVWTEDDRRFRLGLNRGPLLKTQMCLWEDLPTKGVSSPRQSKAAQEGDAQHEIPRMLPIRVGDIDIDHSEPKLPEFQDFISNPRFRIAPVLLAFIALLFPVTVLEKGNKLYLLSGFDFVNRVLADLGPSRPVWAIVFKNRVPDALYLLARECMRLAGPKRESKASAKRLLALGKMLLNYIRLGSSDEIATIAPLVGLSEPIVRDEAREPTDGQ